MQAGRLVLDLADMHQMTTQSYVRRPYGVGMLVAAHDQTGPHLFQTCPSGNYFEYIAMAIGARSQSAKTYLEKHFEDFDVSFALHCGGVLGYSVSRCRFLLFCGRFNTQRGKGRVACICVFVGPPNRYPSCVCDIVLLQVPEVT